VSISTPRLQHANYIASPTNDHANQHLLANLNSAHTLIVQQQDDNNYNTSNNVEYWPKDRPLPYPRWMDICENGNGNGNTRAGLGEKEVGHITKINSAIITTTNHHQHYRTINSPSIVNGTNSGSIGSAAQFSDVVKYEQFAGIIELVSQQTVAGHKYNTVDNFIRFYRAYKKSKIDTVKAFYREYQPPITPCHYTCVGLAFELIHRIQHILPTEDSASNKFYIVSCEEYVESIESYIDCVPPNRAIVEKEHVMVCLPIQIGTRKGYLMLDPGYHVSRVVTVMEDGQYPHTGRFVQCAEGSARKEYEYVMSAPGYVAWMGTDYRKGASESYTNLVFVGKPFLSAVDVAERRNLVYEFKSVVKRDPKGKLLAGLYFVLDKKNPKLTLFYMVNNNRHTIKLNVVKNFKDSPEIRECEHQLGLKKGRLIIKLNTIGRIINDDEFVGEALDLNREIVDISAAN
jgi:hypothetical protein